MGDFVKVSNHRASLATFYRQLLLEDLSLPELLQKLGSNLQALYCPMYSRSDCYTTAEVLDQLFQPAPDDDGTPNYWRYETEEPSYHTFVVVEWEGSYYLLESYTQKYELQVEELEEAKVVELLSEGGEVTAGAISGDPLARLREKMEQFSA